VGGAYFSKIGKSVSGVAIDGAPLIEVLFPNGNCANLNFILDEDFLSSPPPFATVCDISNGYLVNLIGKKNREGFCLYRQKRVGNTLVTVFNDSGAKISFDSDKKAAIESVDFEFSSVDISPLNISNRTFLSVAFIGERTLLNVYDDEYKTVFSRVCDEYSLRFGLTTTERLKDIAGHKVFTEWETENGEFLERKREVTNEKDVNLFSLPDRIKPFAFLEELLVGGNYADLLTEELKEKAEDVKAFFGDFIGVTTPPQFKEGSDVGVVYKTGERTYRVDYATFTLENGKIANFVIK